MRSSSAAARRGTGSSTPPTNKPSSASSRRWRTRFGHLDVLVNNAGIAGVSKPTHEVTLAEWNRVISVNLNGVFLCTKHAIPYLRQAGGGSIINLSSVYGLVGAPDSPPYHAAKGGVRLMSKTDALFYAADGIRVNSVHPGFIWTPMVENACRELGDAEEARRQLAALHPLGIWASPRTSPTASSTSPPTRRSSSPAANW